MPRVAAVSLGVLFAIFLCLGADLHEPSRNLFDSAVSLRRHKRKEKTCGVSGMVQ
jgi:hypothetical protein